MISELLERIENYKAKINELRPFEGNLLKQIRDYYRIGLTWSSNALEGNTLTITETKVVLEDGLTVGGRPLHDLYETVGHGEAYDFMFNLFSERRIDIDDIKTMHRLFYRSIESEYAGVWRNKQIFVTGSDYEFPQPEELETLIKDLDNWIKTERNNYHPVKFAALLHLKFVTIHPFVDGNGRISRLIMNLALIQDGYLLAIVPPVCRLEYLSAIQQYQNKKDDKLFIEFIAERVLETEKEIMRLLHIQ